MACLVRVGWYRYSDKSAWSIPKVLAMTFWVLIQYPKPIKTITKAKPASETETTILSIVSMI